ncbi:class I SAM-dependent methyltransferase [Vibrio ruber]|uniref:class I SAM-dependent methyltransferase n=1 Tax=Vibrio ruber TaxID=184755 RepID=UPI0028930995|nr:class I SAM-dependent methyltransferase [Vibrio ruber]WNJ97399.1 class I SAM-dependent methyltransferase [Vibrio ruber]
MTTVNTKNIHVWNAWVPIHVRSDFYAMDEFKKNPDSLKALDKQLLGDLQGKEVLHLQCHFGQDTLSLAHAGAHVTGVDYSPEAIKTATALAAELNIPAKFVCQDVLELQLDQKFDIIYTSYGVINWLSDLNQWAQVIRRHLKDDGRLVMVEFHPFLNVLDDEFNSIGYDYCNKGDAVTFSDQKSYVNSPDDHGSYTTYEYLHPLSDVINALTNAGITFEMTEYPYSNYNCFPNLYEVSEGSGTYRHRFSIPMMFSIVGQL